MIPDQCAAACVKYADEGALVGTGLMEKALGKQGHLKHAETPSSIVATQCTEMAPLRLEGFTGFRHW